MDSRNTTGLEEQFVEAVNVNQQDINEKTPILLSAERGRIEKVIHLAQRGVGIDVTGHTDTPLHYLAGSKEKLDSYDKCIQLLISKGFDINKLNSSNETPLYLAVCKRNKEMVKSLINSNCDVNIKEGTVSKSILSVAIQIAETTIAKMLIKAGCDVNSTDKNGVTPLMECVTNDNQVVAKLLIGHGASVNAKDNKGLCVLGYLLSSYYHPYRHYSSSDILEMMMEAGLDWTNINKHNKNLCRVIDSGDYKSASLLIEHGIDVNSVDKNGDKPLALASKNCETHLVTLLISKDCDINHQNQRGETALHKAIQVRRYSHPNRSNVIKILLQNRINRNLRDANGQTALYMAVDARDRSITEVLLKAGANVNHCDKSRQTPLMNAVTKMDNVNADILLKAGADLKPRDVLGRTAINLAALLNDSIVLDVLLKFANLRGEAECIDNASYENSKTPLMVVAGTGHKFIVAKLLTAGCNINLQDYGGKTALMFAVDNQNETILSLLLQSGADYNIGDKNGKTALMAAVEKQRDGHCKEWMKYGASVNHVDNNGNTALMIAVRLNNGKIVNDLLKAGADVNLSDSDGNTALMIAVGLNNGKIVNDLLKAGADVNLSDSDGHTALMIAVWLNNGKIVNGLLKAGADVNLSDSDGQTALMTAARNCNRSILECLLKAGADVNKTDTDGRSAIHGIMVGARGRKWINCLKLVLMNKCHVTLGILFKWLLERNQADSPCYIARDNWLVEKDVVDLVRYLVTENCSLKGFDLRRVKCQFRFPDNVTLSKILFESGAPQRETENIISVQDSTYNLIPGESNDTCEEQLADFRDFCKSRSLKSRCRREIRHCIGPGISSKITQVGLPQRLQDYVVMKDLIPEKYFTLVINNTGYIYDEYHYYF